MKYFKASRIVLHIGFWLAFVALYALVYTLFASPSDLAYPIATRYMRSLFSEILLLPCKAIPFYVIFYWILPSFYSSKNRFQALGYTLALFVSAVLLYRITVPWINFILYNEWSMADTLHFKRLLYAFGDILPAIALAASIKLFRGRIDQQKRELDLIREKLQAELNFLKAQTNPHFLFNTLNNIYGLAREKDENTAPAIMRLSRIMRFILFECEKAVIPISMEIEMIEEYIELEKLRYHNPIDIQLNITLDNPSDEIPPLLLLPFVENAFKHGASENLDESYVHIFAELKTGELTYQVENNCQPREASSTKGIGLENVKRQLDLLFPNKHDLDISIQQEQFSVLLRLSLQ